MVHFFFVRKTFIYQTFFYKLSIFVPNPDRRRQNPKATSFSFRFVSMSLIEWPLMRCDSSSLPVEIRASTEHFERSRLWNPFAINTYLGRADVSEPVAALISCHDNFIGTTATVAALPTRRNLIAFTRLACLGLVCDNGACFRLLTRDRSKPGDKKRGAASPKFPARLALQLSDSWPAKFTRPGKQHFSWVPINLGHGIALALQTRGSILVFLGTGPQKW